MFKDIYNKKKILITGNTGFKGRMGLYEVLNVTKPIKEAILLEKEDSDLEHEMGILI